jgi:CDP-diacylglycerol---serine O-phosphatidyltransferase
MFVVRQIPNALTSANLFLGAVGTYVAIIGRPDIAVWCILVAALFDFLDGFAARMLHAYSDIGKDLDSLADLISFGFAPAAVFSSMIHYYLTGSWGGQFMELAILPQLLLLLPFMLTVFAALRLAKFNNDIRQTESFIGLTTTATGMFTVSLGYLVYTNGGWFLNLTNPWVVMGLVAVFCGLLVSEIPMFSLKFKRFGWRNNEHRFVLLIISIAAVVLLGAGALVVIVPVYVVYSVVLMFLKRSNN